MNRRSRSRLGGVAALVAVAAFVAVPTATAAPSVAAGVYVALGDSYTSGPGVPDQDPASGACARSSRNYPSLLAQALAPAGFVDTSCSGAVTDNMVVPQGSAPPQFDALTADTTLVTLTIGGNDASFLDVIGNCSALAANDPAGHPCQDAYTAGGVDRVDQVFAEKAPKIAAVLQGIHERSPLARVVLVGYQAILPASPAGCAPDSPDGRIVASGDFAYLAAKQRVLADTLAAAAAANNATFVDANAATTGHEACTAPGVRWLEGVSDVTGASPAHPNALGMRAVATLIRSALGA